MDHPQSKSIQPPKTRWWINPDVEQQMSAHGLARATTREYALAALADALRDDPAALAMEARIDGQTYVAVRADVGLAVRIECRGT